MRARLRSRQELALVAVALLLPIPLLAASGVMVPLPSAVERGLVSLVTGGGADPGRDADAAAPGSASPTSFEPTRTTTSGVDQVSAGALSEGGNATPPAEESGAAGSDDSSADNVLPGDERMLPGGGNSDLPAAPSSPGAPADTGTSPTQRAPAGARPAAEPDLSATATLVESGVHVEVEEVPGPGSVEVDVSEEVLAVSLETSDDTPPGPTVTVPLPTVPLP